MKTEGNIKGVLLEFLKFAEYQVQNDRCSLKQRQVIDGESMTRLCLQMARAWLNDPDKGDRNIRWYLQL